MPILLASIPTPGIALEPVLAEHVERARGWVLVADRLHDHRRVRRQRAGVVGREQRAAGRGHVLDALDLDPEPVAVVEVEHRLHRAGRRAPSGPSRRPGGRGSGGAISPVEVAQRRRLGGSALGRRAAGRRRRPRRRRRPGARGSSAPASAGERPAQQRALRAQSGALCSAGFRGEPPRGGILAEQAPGEPGSAATARRTAARRRSRPARRRRPRPRRRARPRAAGSPARSGRGAGETPAEVTRPTSRSPATTRRRRARPAPTAAGRAGGGSGCPLWYMRATGSWPT